MLRFAASRPARLAARAAPLLALLLVVPRAEAAARPDLVLILADDLGWGDLGVQGSHEVRTPHLDALARGGVRFTQAYVSAPLCAPMRAGLLTGRDANRFGYTGATGTYGKQVREDRGVPTSELLLTELLSRAGYAVGVFGKWHLGVNPRFRPRARGADRYFGPLAGAHSYFDWGGGLFGPVFRDDAPATGSGYLTDAITDEAVAFVKHHAHEPFFLYVPYTAVHAPFEAPPERVAAYAGLEPRQRRVLAAMLEILDDGVGRILAALSASGRERDTLVVFLSDNGGIAPLSSNGPLRGGKGSLLEGGIRVPMFARWPAVLPAGVVRDAPVSSLDLFPTLLAAAGVPAPADRTLDGVDLLPLLRGESTARPHERLCWRSSGSQRAIRRGTLKLAYYWEDTPEGRETGSGLFDLASDPGERHDLRARRPEAAAELEAELAACVEALRVRGAPAQGPPGAGRPPAPPLPAAGRRQR